MNRGHLAYRYAKGLYLTAHDDKRIIARYGRELKLFRDLYVNEKLDKVLNNPAFLLSERYLVIDRICDAFDLHRYMRNFLKLMEKRGRMELIDDVLRSYRKLLDATAGMYYVNIETDADIPYDLYAEYRRKAQEIIEGIVSLRSRKVPEQLGVGARIEIGEKFVDVSIEGMAQRMLARLGIPKGG